VADGVTGLIVPPRDDAALAAAVNALVRDPHRAAGLGARGRERAVAEFSWARIAAQTAELYARLAGR
jgi:glycosyltransferase involved in cell wall biosynthesis